MQTEREVEKIVDVIRPRGMRDEIDGGDLMLGTIGAILLVPFGGGHRNE